MAETKSVIIDLMNGTSGASLNISQFTDNFDTVRFLVNQALKDYTFMIVTLSEGRTRIIPYSDTGLFTESSESGDFFLVWKLGREITSTSGIVVYQVVAYESDGEEIKSTWYSKEGRITVSQSIDTNAESAKIIGSYPNLITRIILELESHEKNMENLENTKVSVRDGYGLSQNDFTDSNALKLNSIEESAEKNIIEKIKVNGNALKVNSYDKSVNIDISSKAERSEFSEAAFSGNYADLNGIPLTDLGNIDVSLDTVEKKFESITETGIYKFTLTGMGLAGVTTGSHYAFVTYYTDAIGNHIVSQLFLGDAYNVAGYRCGRKNTMTAGGEEFEWESIHDFITKDKVSSQVSKSGTLPVNSKAVYSFVRPAPVEEIPQTLSANTSYNFASVPDKMISFPSPEMSNDGDVIYLTFMVGSTVPEGLTIDTTHTSDIDIEFFPDTGYEIFGKFNGSVWIVNYSEYTVTNGEVV